MERNSHARDGAHESPLPTEHPLRSDSHLFSAHAGAPSNPPASPAPALPAEAEPASDACPSLDELLTAAQLRGISPFELHWERVKGSPVSAPPLVQQIDDMLFDASLRLTGPLSPGRPRPFVKTSHGCDVRVHRRTA